MIFIKFFIFPFSKAHWTGKIGALAFSSYFNKVQILYSGASR